MSRQPSSRSRDRPSSASRVDQGELLSAGEIDRPVRAIENAVRKSVEAAQLSDLYAGAGALAVGIARATDVALARRDPYGVAAAARELREQLIRLRLDPASVDNVDGAVADLVKRMSEPDPVPPSRPDPTRPNVGPR